METVPHVPVLADRIVEFLRPCRDGIVVDCTLGAGGHARRILAEVRPRRLIALDRDLEALARTAPALRGLPGEKLCAWSDFRSLDRVLGRLGIERVDGILADLGVSSMQLDLARRGFSFQADGPLDMRMDRASGPTAADLAGGLAEAELAKILWEYGEEKRSFKIARRIVESRADGPIDTTGRLRAIVHGAIGTRSGRIDSATRTFQALRLAVNGELAALEALLAAAAGRLAPGGRACLLTFHSLEDRLVKRFVRREARDCICDGRLPACVCGHRATLRDLTPHPVEAAAAETAANPRARSAKLRVFERR